MLKQYYTEDLVEAGCDEAGRGCLAGPVFAAAVILPKDFTDNTLDDSKKLSAVQRIGLREIIEKKAVCWAVGIVDNYGIDKINILKASLKAMHLALDKLTTKPQLILIDGNRFINYQDIPHKCIVKGDSEYMSIAAASILAKTYRDEYMEELHSEFPQYNWLKNKGYGTKDHKKAIAEFGITSYHRRSFKLNEQLKLDL
jgi:ribonuclease HII